MNKVQLRKTHEELIKHKRMQRKLATKSQKVLRTQANLLCSALQVLKRRSDTGQETAGQIWASLIDGITAVIPAEFFNEQDRNYFWETDEKLTTNEQAFQKLLDQACLKKNGIAGGCCDEDKTKALLPENNSVEVRELTDIMFPESSKSLTVKPYEEEEEEEKKFEEEGIEENDLDADNLVTHLIDMLKVAVARTELDYWDWKEDEDDELKLEIASFNGSLKSALQLFMDIRNSPDLSGLIEAIESLSETGTTENMLGVMKTVSDLGSALSGPVPSEASSFFDYSDEDVDDDGEDSESEESDVDVEDFDSTSAQVDSDEEKSIVLCKNENVNKVQKTFPGPSSSTSAKRSTPKQDDISAGSERFIPKNKPAAGGKSTTVKSCRNEQCTHAGYTFPTSHYRDWKRDGFRCVCGQRFRFLNAMDRHIFMQQELRILSCDKCTYKVNRKCCLEKHKRDAHEKPKMLKAHARLYQCMFGCDSILNSKQELYKHQKETDRQCTFVNASKLPVKSLPSTPLSFIDSLRGTFARANISLTVDNLSIVLTAAEKDAARMRKAREESEKIKMAAQVQEDVHEGKKNDKK